MRNIIKKIIVWKLDCLAKMYLWRFKPEIIAITGNVGKTSTKEAVAAVLAKTKKVRSGKGNLNNEFGVPLTIIGNWSDDYYDAGNSFFFWCKVLTVSFIGWFFTRNYPEILVLEFGADRPGDISRLARKYKPKVGIITAVGDIPVHVEYFNDPDSLAREKSKLISSMKQADYAILNHDDNVVYEMKSRTKAKVVSYGFTEGATVQLSNFDFRLSPEGKPSGVGFKIHYGANSFVPVTLNGMLGKSQAYSAGAATAVGVIYGMNLIEISEALLNYKGPNGRLKIIDGIKNSVIIDDTYNAAPSSTHLALDTLKNLPLQQVQGKPPRRIAVLGDMLELGKYTIDAHTETGNLAASIVDVLVTVGLRGKFIAVAAENNMDSKNIYSFPTSDLAKIKVQELIQNPPDGVAMGDLILVKGSQGARMEKIVEEIMAEPLRKKDLLVRQGRKWSSK